MKKKIIITIDNLLPKWQEIIFQSPAEKELNIETNTNEDSFIINIDASQDLKRDSLNELKKDFIANILAEAKTLNLMFNHREKLDFLALNSN